MIIMIIQLLFAILTLGHAAVLDPAILKRTATTDAIILLNPQCVRPINISQLKVQSAECAFKATRASGIRDQNVRPLWISHSAAVKASNLQLKALSQNPLVKKIYFNHPFEDIYSSEENSPSPHPYNLEQTGISKLHNEFSNLDGSNQLIGVIDTGVDGSHAELKDKIESFFDADQNKITEATDLAGHGTHVSGLLVSSSVGVAPGAKLIVAKMQNIVGALSAMQFIVDFNAKSPKKVRVVNNSWGEQELPDIELYYRALNLWQTQGIIPVFSAGNLGPKEKTVVHPKEHPSTIVVGSTMEDGTVAKYSSRGPIDYHGQVVFKPELVAPGDKIISTLPENRFGVWSGTSMAAPLVAGTIALMLEAQPQLTPEQIRSLLIRTANSPDHKWTLDKGYGLLNAYDAVTGAFGSVLTLSLSAVMPAENGIEHIFDFPQYLEGSFTSFPSPE